MERGDVHKSLMRTIRYHYKIFRSRFAEINISKGQPRILNYLAGNDGCSQKDIAKNCDIEAATATNVLTTMEKVGFIERIPNKNDRRILNVYLTEEGKEAQRNVKKLQGELEESCFMGFSEEEMELAKSIFDRIYDNLKKGEISLDD